MISVDGSYLEGGGQILRTSLSLSCITGKGFEITDIRANRKNPGLQAQHLASANALAKIFNAEIKGNEMGSTKLFFSPRERSERDFVFQIGTAGSTSLLLQTIFFPLCLQKEECTAVVSGGTHVPFSPSFHSLQGAFSQLMQQAGFEFDLSISKWWGFYPRGGGEVKLKTKPTNKIEPFGFLERGELKKIKLLSVCSNLPLHVAERQAKGFEDGLKNTGFGGVEFSKEVVHVPGLDKGSFCFALAEYENSCADFSSLGELGKPAEKVGSEVAKKLLDFHASGACVDEHLCDQLVVPALLAGGESEFACRITKHLLTNAFTAKKFFPEAEIGIIGDEGSVGKVKIIPNCSR
jgi:RNA 3'-terminal phosphate cyclase (ATP)